MTVTSGLRWVGGVMAPSLEVGPAALCANSIIIASGAAKLDDVLSQERVVK